MCYGSDNQMKDYVHSLSIAYIQTRTHTTVLLSPSLSHSVKNEYLKRRRSAGFTQWQFMVAAILMTVRHFNFIVFEWAAFFSRASAACVPCIPTTMRTNICVYRRLFREKWMPFIKWSWYHWRMNEWKKRRKKKHKHMRKKTMVKRIARHSVQWRILPEINPECIEREGINCTHTSFKNRLH